VGGRGGAAGRECEPRESIVIVGLVACSLAITCCWLLPETRGKVIVEEERERGAEPRVAQPTAIS
jgi:hypothetical protein